METLNRSISADFYLYLQSIGSRYEGYVVGVGYVSSELVADVSPTPTYPNQARWGGTNNTCFITPKYVPVIIPVETDPKYDGITASDILHVIRKKNRDGSIRVNLGNNRIVELSPDSFVNVRIREETFGDKREKVATIITRDAENGSITETKLPINGIEYILKEDHMAFQMPQTQDGMVLSDEQRSNASMKDVISFAGQAIAYMGLSVTVGQVITYDKFLKRWLGKNRQFYSLSYGGNRATGGRDKYAYMNSKQLGKIGNVFGFTSFLIIGFQWQRGDISTAWTLAEGVSTSLSTWGGSRGIAWGIGWELGRWIIKMESYQRFKFNFWYDYWESKFGPPSEKNKEIWRYFYENYKF